LAQGRSHSHFPVSALFAFICNPMATSNAFTELKAMTIIVADTGELDKIKAILPQDATTNPSLIFQAMNTDDGKVKFDKAISDATKKMGNNVAQEALVSEVCDRLAVMIGCEIL